MKKLTAIVMSLFLVACNTKEEDPQTEDYAALFPWKGIEKPETAYEDMKINICDPKEALTEYTNKSVEIQYQREYIVTLKATFTESSMFFFTNSNYEVRYVDENGKIIRLMSHNQLVSGQEWTTSFKVKSGYPLYLLVNGAGNRESSIKAEISAKSVDETVVVPSISIDEKQNAEGVVGLANPICEYIILP